MSFYQQNLQAFMRLLQEQPQLFSESKCQELMALIEPLPMIFKPYRLRSQVGMKTMMKLWMLNQKS